MFIVKCKYIIYIINNLLFIIDQLIDTFYKFNRPPNYYFHYTSCVCFNTNIKFFFLNYYNVLFLRKVFFLVRFPEKQQTNIHKI